MDFWIYNDRFFVRCNYNVRFKMISRSAPSLISKSERNKENELKVSELDPDSRRIKLVEELKDKFKQFLDDQEKILKHTNLIRKEYRDSQLRIITRSGIYSIHVLEDLESNGLTLKSIAKAMKFGLVSLDLDELSCFKNFSIDPKVLQDEQFSIKELDDKLIEYIRPSGLSDQECWNILINGLMNQDPETLCQLIANGINVLGILNCQMPMNNVSTKLVEFLRDLGIEEDLLEALNEFGMDNRILEVIHSLGYDELQEEIDKESNEIMCKCNLLQREEKVFKKRLNDENAIDYSSNSSDVILSLQDLWDMFCQHHDLGKSSNVDLTAERNTYLRDTVLEPLTWAMAKLLNSLPADPQHYLAHQLLRWSHGSVSKVDRENVAKFVAKQTRILQHKLNVSL